MKREYIRNFYVQHNVSVFSVVCVVVCGAQQMRAQHDARNRQTCPNLEIIVHDSRVKH